MKVEESVAVEVFKFQNNKGYFAGNLLYFLFFKYCYFCWLNKYKKSEQ